MQQNYRLFYEFLCQEKVPLALVVTNLENEVNMDDWWMRNKAHVEKSGVVPTMQVCITTIKGHQNAYENRYFESRKKVHHMLRVLGSAEPYSVDVSSWFVRMCRLLPELLLTAKTLGRSRQKMMRMLTKRCKLRKEDAVQLLQRIDSLAIILYILYHLVLSTESDRYTRKYANRSGQDCEMRIPSIRRLRAFAPIFPSVS